MDWADFSGFMTSGFFAKKGKKRYCRNGKYHFSQLITRRGARGTPPVAGGVTRASGSGLYFQGGFAHCRKYRAPQQGVGSSVPSATRRKALLFSNSKASFLCKNVSDLRDKIWIFPGFVHPCLAISANFPGRHLVGNRSAKNATSPPVV